MIQLGDRDLVLRLGLVLGVVLAVRLVSLWFNNSELFFDEAQYWFWSRELDFGYFSKPPLIAWLIAATTELCGDNSSFCVRLSAPLLHIVTAIMIFLSARRLFDARVGFWAALLYALMPAVSLSSTIMSTDVPMLFFWSLALYCYIRLQEDFAVEWALFLGVAIGLGVNAKYAMSYFVGCALVHALVEQQNYTPPRKLGFWLACLVAIAMLVPNVLWNAANGFVTFAHTSDNIGWSAVNLNWKGLGEFLGSQFGVFGPITLTIFLITAVRMLANSLSREHRLLAAFSVPVFALILFQAVLSKAYANWAAATFIAASILTAEIMVNRISWNWMRVTLGLHGFVFVALALAVCFAGPGQIVLPDGRQPFERTQGATLIASAVETQLDAYDYNGIITTDRKLSALMVYNLRNRDVSIHAWRTGDVPKDHFQLAIPFQESLRDPVLVLSRWDNIEAYNAGFETVVPLGAVDIAAGEIERVYFFRLEGHESFQ